MKCSTVVDNNAASFETVDIGRLYIILTYFLTYCICILNGGVSDLLILKDEYLLAIGDIV